MMTRQMRTKEFLQESSVGTCVMRCISLVSTSCPRLDSSSSGFCGMLESRPGFRRTGAGLAPVKFRV